MRASFRASACASLGEGGEREAGKREGRRGWLRTWGEGLGRGGWEVLEEEEEEEEEDKGEESLELLGARRYT